MSEESDSDARIRALLAELGSGPEGEEIPAAVAARLDDTLARLVTERGRAGEAAAAEAATTPAQDDHADQADQVGPGSEKVIPLRRRVAARTAAAAAAVIVLGAGGIAVANLWTGGSSSDRSATSAGGASAEDTAPAPSSDPGTDLEGLTGKAAEAARTIPRVRSVSFAADVVPLVATARSRAAQSSPDQDALLCRGPRLTAGATRQSVVYDDTLAVLVVHPVRQGRQLVEAWTCAGTRRLDAARITP